jgi:hypothetical protein
MTPRMIALRFATSRQQDENWRENKCQPAQGVQPGESGGENHSGFVNLLGGQCTHLVDFL